MREVEARLKISATDKTAAAFQSLSGRLNRINGQVDTVNRRMKESTVRQMADVERISNRVSKVLALAGTAYAGAEMFKNFAQWDRRLTRIGINANATQKQIEGAGDAVFRLSKEMAVTPDSLVEGLDTLVASGKNLEESLAFLPSIAKAAQASGADVDGIAKTTISLAGAMGIAADKMDSAFDLMSAQGKAGMFELKDMASEMPTVANAYSTLGDKGVAGLTRLNAMLQTIREGTATSSDAAIQATNVFLKMNSPETRNKFKKMGVDLQAEMKAAAKRGQPPVEAFVDITRKTLNGDLSKLSDLFQDQQVFLGMNSLLTKGDSYKRYLTAGRDKNVPGTVDRDVKKITADAQSAIDRMSASLMRMTNSLGKAVQQPVSSILDTVSESTDMESAARAGLEKRGYTGWRKELMLLNKLPIGPFPASSDYEQLAREGGYVPANRPDLKAMQRDMPVAYNVLGRYPQRPVTAVPKSRVLDQWQRDMTQRADHADDQARATRPGFRSSFPARSEMVSNNEPRLSNLKLGRDDGFADFAKQIETQLSANKTEIAADGKAAGDHLKDGAGQGADAILRAMQESAVLLFRAAAQAAAAISAAKPSAASTAERPKVNANVGRTSDFVRTPSNAYHGPK